MYILAHVVVFQGKGEEGVGKARGAITPPPPPPLDQAAIMIIIYFTMIWKNSMIHIHCPLYFS